MNSLFGEGGIRAAAERPARRGFAAARSHFLRTYLLPFATLVVLSISSTAAFGQATAQIPSDVRIDGDYGYGLPPDISTHGAEIDQLIHVMHWFMGVLFVGWGIFFVFCLMRFRQRPGHRAEYELIKAKPSKYAEIAVALFEAVLLIAFAMPAWAKAKNQPPDPSTALHVRVVGEQFAWNFHYAGANNRFGTTDPKAIDTAINAVGVIRSGDGEDDVIAGELHIPSGRPVICHISSKDVIHSFAIPVLRVKQDAIPGMRIPVWFQTKEGATGTFEVSCAQLCGNNHYKMKALMVVEPPAKFEAWLKEKGTKKEFEED